MAQVSGGFVPDANKKGGQVEIGLDEQLRLGGGVTDFESPVAVDRANFSSFGIGKKPTTTIRGAVNRLYQMTPAQIAQLQNQLAEAGLIPEEAITQNRLSWGSVDKFTEAAWTDAITLHLKDKRKTVNGHIEDRRRTNAPRWQVLQEKLASGDDGQTDTVSVSNPAEIRANVDNVAQQLLGRKATAAEKAQLTSMVQGGQIATGNARAGVNQSNRRGASEGGSFSASGPVDDTTGSKIAGEMASRFGLRVTSTVRDPEHNRKIGGAKNSDHLPGGDFAADFGGTKTQMDAFAAWARSNSGQGKVFKKVIYGTGDHKDHVHVTYNQSPTGVPVGGGVGGDDTDRFMAATRAQESGDRYDWNLTSRAGARGAYQFMPGTWMAAAKLAGVDPKDHSPGAQDAAAKALMTKYYQEFGDWQLVAVAWHAGPGKARKIKARGGGAGTNDGLINTDDYAKQVVGRMGSARTATPTSNMGGVAVIEEAGGEAFVEEELRRRNPTEAAGHDVAGAFGSFLKILNGPVG